MGLAGSTAADVAEWRVEPGLTAYPDALEVMQARAAAIRDGTAAALVWLVEHPPLYSAGTSAKPGDLLDPGRFPTYRAGRGGQWTYHGPGQRLAYVLMDLERRHGLVKPRDVRCFVWGLEEWLIRALARLGVAGERRAGRVGIWAPAAAGRDEAKLAAIGVRVTRWVSWHGIALNVDPDLTHFDGVIPCGLAGHGVSSLRALGIPAEMAMVDDALRAGWREVFESEGQRNDCGMTATLRE